MEYGKVKFAGRERVTFTLCTIQNTLWYLALSAFILQYIEFWFPCDTIAFCVHTNFQRNVVALHRLRSATITTSTNEFLAVRQEMRHFSDDLFIFGIF